jgi:hypothetical protein
MLGRAGAEVGTDGTVGAGGGAGRGAGDGTGTGTAGVGGGVGSVGVGGTVGGGGSGAGTGTVGTVTVGGGGAGTGDVTVGTGVVTLTVGSGGTCALPTWTSTCAAAKPPIATITPSSLPRRFISRRPPDRDVCNYNGPTTARGADVHCRAGGSLCRSTSLPDPRGIAGRVANAAKGLSPGRPLAGRGADQRLALQR